MGIHDLKPCPFCGGSAGIVVLKKDESLMATASIYCERCNVMISYLNRDKGTTEMFKSPKDAAEMWNTRTYII
jgi:Lar family restriction alleviation protein